jgi:3-phosphoshikimate 1-carboxyvinyltransferase
MASMKPFIFSGEVPASKSILNRLLIIQSFAKDLEVYGDSLCDDVVRMRSALRQVLDIRGENANCGAAGTTFRFLALRASRVPGRHVLVGTHQLRSRPQGALLEIMQALGVTASLMDQGLLIESRGWKKPTKPLRVDRSHSSQFASAILLNAWNLDFQLELEFPASLNAPSEGYFEMTKSLVQAAGMRLMSDGSRTIVPLNSQVTASSLHAEPDLSSAFSLAAVAVASQGQSHFKTFPRSSLQPDAVFPELLKAMGVIIDTSHGLFVKGQPNLRPIKWNLQDCPDLFPVLSVLCALAKGRSVLYGAPHLAHKESNRIESTAKLLRGLGVQFNLRADGIEIDGRGTILKNEQEFDPLHDHRLAMAAAVANASGARIRILYPSVVDKSFPEFWTIVEQGQRKRDA